VAAERARADAQLTPPERSQRAAAYLARGWEMLLAARSRGLFKDPTNVRRLEEEPDLKPLRAQPGFANFLKELARKR
jgi:hypothetical protein